MIRASALYISVIVSLMIVIVCGTMLMAGLIYRMQDKQQERHTRLDNNVASGMQILLGEQEWAADTVMSVGLFDPTDEGISDSVRLEKQAWGLYDIGRVSSWIGGDTLRRSFMMAPLPEDTLMVLYVSDEDRPVSISGKSLIRGTAYLPKSGIRSAYVDGAGYKDKTLVHGLVWSSGRDMRTLNEGALLRIKELMASSLDTSQNISLSKQMDLSGQVIDQLTIVSADSLIIVNEYTKLDKAILIAPFVRIGPRFRGNVQVFARDSASIGDSVKLEYPSAVVVLQQDTAGFQARLTIGKHSEIEGALLMLDDGYIGKNGLSGRRTLMPVLSISDSCRVDGEVWSKGYVKIGRSVVVNGSVSTIRLMASHKSILYENYLIDVLLNARARSRYYLSPALLNAKRTKRKVLCWLD